MTDLRRLFIALTVTCGLSMVPVVVSASRKATDLMSEALKQRAAGNLGEAISSFQVAAEQAGNDTQKNLARFMLGDCQLEAGRYADAADTFTALREAVNTPEEKAEALFRLMQAQTSLGNRSQAKSLYAQLQRQHPASPYFELAKSFMKTEGIKDAIEEAPTKPESPVRLADSKPSAPVAAADSAVVTRPVSEPKLVSEPDKVADSETAPTSDILPDEDNEAEPETIVVPVNPAAEPVKASRTVEAQSARRPPVSKEKQPVSGSGKTGKRLSPETSALLREVLQVDTAVGAAKDELVGKILSLQDTLKDGPDKSGMDQVLFDLAETTVRFGELLEACKTYDKILTHHPVSPLVEKAYYQAIRLRAVLGVHEAVIGWSKAFLAAFPASEYRSQIRALVEYAQAAGNIDLTEGGRVEVATKKAAPAPGNDDAVAANAALAADSQYVAATRKMKDGRYNLAQVDFNRLAAKYPGAPQIWWDSALVNVQLEDFKKAAQAINKMLELDPGNEDANSLSGYIHYRLENFEEAASAYKQAGEPEGRGVNFFDAKNASERMQKSAGKNSKQKEN